MKKYAVILFFSILCPVCYCRNGQTDVAHHDDETTETASVDEGSTVKPETIETFVAYQYDAEWYGEQARAWQKKVDMNPQDQWAWRNLFRATYYYDLFSTQFAGNQDELATADVIRKMEDAIPDSYVLNLSKSRFCLSSDSVALSGEPVYRAIEKMPEDACAGDINYLACRLWGLDPTNKKVKELFSLGYRKHVFPQRIMQYNWNMLRSMQPNAIYFANGDVATAPMKMLQDALGERQDVTVIPLSFLCMDDYREMVFKKLNILPFDSDVTDYEKKYGDEWSKRFSTDIVMHIIHESERPVYFFSDILYHTQLDKDSIYNEGLLLKYSEKQYDNFTVAMNNVKNIYHLEYLAEPDLVYSTWEADARLDINNVTLLSHLVSRFRDSGDAQEADRLYNILYACLKRCPIEPEYKQQIEKQLKAETK